MSVRSYIPTERPNVTRSVKRALPSRRADVAMTARTVGGVVRSPRYAIATAVGALLGLVFIVATQNPQLFLSVLVFGNLPVMAKLGVLWGLLPFVSPAFPLVDGLFVVLTAGLIGLNVSMMSYRLAAGGSIREGSGSTLGSLVGVFGVGCTACGLPIVGEIAILLGISGGAGSLAFLPFGGLSFAILALSLLALSLYWIARRIDGEAACSVDVAES